MAGLNYTGKFSDKRQSTESRFLALNETLEGLNSKIRLYVRNPKDTITNQRLYVNYYERGKRKQTALISLLDTYEIDTKDILPCLIEETTKQAKELNNITLDRIFTALTELNGKLKNPKRHESNVKLLDYINKLIAESKKNAKAPKTQLLKWLNEFDKYGFLNKDVKLKNVDGEYLDTFFYNLKQTSLKDYTKKNIYSTFRAVLYMAEENNLIAKNPISEMKKKNKPKILNIDTNKITYLQGEQIKELTECYKNETNKAHKKALQIFLFECYTGFRAGDILALKWENIDLKKNTITIVEQKTKKTMVKELKATAKKYLPPVQNSGLVFGKCYGVGYIDRLLKKYNNVVGVNLRSHIGRHTFAVLYLYSTGDISTLKKELNHSSILTTEIYAKVTETKRVENMAKFDTFANQFFND